MDRADLIAAAEAMLRRQLWAQRMIGSAPLAAALLLSAVREGDEWLTAKELADMTELSDDTIRRHLFKLEGIGRVLADHEVAPAVYRLSPEMLAKAISLV